MTVTAIEMSSEPIKVQDAERMAYLEIISKLIQLINPEKFVELERLQVDKSLAMIQQLEMYKRQAQQDDIEKKTQERMLELITQERQKQLTGEEK